MPELRWIGKDKVINHHLDVPYHVLERQYSYVAGGATPCDDCASVDPALEENKIIHGDNLLALKALLPQYEGKIDCIYIEKACPHSIQSNASSEMCFEGENILLSRGLAA